MRLFSFLLVVLVLCFFVAGFNTQQIETPIEHHEDIAIEQIRDTPTRTPGPTIPLRSAPTTTPTRPPIGSRIRDRPITRDDIRDARPIAGDDIRGTRPITRDDIRRIDRDIPIRDIPIRMTRREIRMARALIRMLRDMMEMRMREIIGMRGDIPLSRWEKRMIRMLAIRDMMMMMNIQGAEVEEIASIIQEHEDIIPENTIEETDIETEPQADHEIEAEDDIAPESIPEHDIMIDQEMEDPTLIETDFDISQFGYGKKGGYGGYGGYGKKGGYGGYGGWGGKKGGGFGFGFGGKKGGIGFSKKFPPKKIPFKKAPIKKGGFI